MIMGALAIFLTSIWVLVHTDKFIINIGVRNILDTKITWSGNMLRSGWLVVSLHYYNRLNAVMN